MKHTVVGLIIGLAFPVLVWGSPGVLEAPQDGSHQSGLGFISGWVCNAANVVVIFDGGTSVPILYGAPRPDTVGVCGDTNNGFVLAPFNWNLLGDGIHTVSVQADGVVVGSATVTITTFGVEFLTGAHGSCKVQNFPQAGKTTKVRWQQSLQNFIITKVK